MNVMYRFVLALILATVSTHSIAAVPIDRVVAIINEEVITQSQLDHAMALDKKALESSGEHLSAADFQKQELDKLILQNLQLQIAKRAKVTLTDTELDAAITKIASNNHLTTSQLYDIIARQGMTEKQFKAQIHDEIIISRVEHAAVGRNVHVTDQEVKDFMKSAPRQMDDAQYHLADMVISLNDNATPDQIAIGKKKAEDILHKLRGGADFAKLAMTDSSGSESGQGGDLGWRKLSELPDIFVPSVKTLQTGAYTAPIQAPNGFHILKLIEVKNNKPLTEADAKGLITQRKFQDQLQIWLQQVRNTAYIKVML